MQSCRDVAYLIASDGLEHAGWPTRLLVHLHLLYCRRCRRYAADLDTIGHVSRDTWKITSVDPRTVQRLEGVIIDQASGKSGDRPPETSGDASLPSDA